MDWILTIHTLFGERVLPLLIIFVAVWITATWKPGFQPDIIARSFPILVMLQFTLGLIYWLYGLVRGLAPLYLSFPFILHPVLGLLAVLLAGWAIKPDSEKNPLRRMMQPLGRWAPMVVLLLLFVIVMGSVITGYSI